MLLFAQHFALCLCPILRHGQDGIYNNLLILRTKNKDSILQLIAGIAICLFLSSNMLGLCVWDYQDIALRQNQHQ